MTATDADLIVPVWQDCGFGNGRPSRLFDVDDRVQYLVAATALARCRKLLSLEDGTATEHSRHVL